MTTKAAFSPEEWKTVLQGPPTAGMIVVTAARGGMIRETIAMAKAYSEAHARPGESENLAPLMPRHLRHDVGRGAEAVDADPLRLAGQAQGAIAD